MHQYSTKMILCIFIFQPCLLHSMFFLFSFFRLVCLFNGMVFYGTILNEGLGTSQFNHSWTDVFSHISAGQIMLCNIMGIEHHDNKWVKTLSSWTCDADPNSAMTKHIIRTVASFGLILRSSLVGKGINHSKPVLQRQKLLFFCFTDIVTYLVIAKEEIEWNLFNPFQWTCCLVHSTY